MKYIINMCMNVPPTWQDIFIDLQIKVARKGTIPLYIMANTEMFVCYKLK